jgi:hypothetical protein
VNFIYRLTIKHPTFLGKKIMTLLENRLENELKSLFQEFTKHNGRQKLYIQRLLFSEDHHEINTFRRCKTLLVVLRCRGLLRTLLFLIPLPGLEVPGDLHDLKRMDIFRILLRERAIFFSHIVAKLKLVHPSPTDLFDVPLIIDVMRFNLKELENYRGRRRFYFDFQNDDAPIYGNDNLIKLPSKEIFFYKLVIWDSHGLANFILKKQMRDISKLYFDEIYPQFPLKVEEFEVLQVRVLPRYDEVLDFDSTRNIQSDYQVLQSAQIWHQRFIISNKEFLVHDSTSHPEQEFVAGQWHYIKSFDGGGNKCLIKKVLGGTKYLKSGIFLSGRCDENWFHFIIDTVPRILFVSDIPRDVPLLIRSDIPENSKSVLASITNREIIEIESNEILEVQNLYVVPGRSSVFDSKPPKGSSFVEFSPTALKSIRSLLLNAQNEIGSNSLVDTSAHTIALSRSSKTRNIQNWSSLNQVIKNFGFVIYELNDVFFRNQIKTFNNARILIAPGGAALANILFMPPGSVVVVLRSWRNRDLELWVKLAKSMDVNCVEITGVPTYFGPGKLRRAHSDFYISPRKLRKVLASVTASTTR